MEESEPLLQEQKRNGECRISRKRLKVTAIALASLAAVAVLSVAGVFISKTYGNSKTLDQDSVLTLSAQQASCKKPFQPFTQFEIEALKLPKSSLSPDLVELLSDEETAWLLEEKVPAHLNNTVQKHRRKEVRTLTSEEWQTYARAVRKMKLTYPTSGRRSEYDVMVAVHAPGISPFAHFGPATLPWHRVYLDKYESILATHEPNVSLPYWDTVLDEPLPTPKHSILWSDALVGTFEGPVTSGVFAGHTNPRGYCTDIFGEFLQRGVNNKTNRLLVLLSNDIIQYMALNYTSYSELIAPATLNPAEDASSILETYHASVHAFVGGDIGNVPCAPVDPVFWLWHASLDLVWEEFRQESQATNRQTDYPTLPNVNPGYLPYAPMWPFASFPNIYGLSDHFTAYRYEYSPRPTKYSCSVDADCGSSLGYLWCNECGQCVSKVQVGGDCTGLPDKSCFCSNDLVFKVSKCVSNLCSCN